MILLTIKKETDAVAVNHSESDMWSREDTKNWVFQIEHRLEDFEYYLKQTETWCEYHGILNEAQLFMCYTMTLVWVNYMRGEKLTKAELFEILGFEEYEFSNDLYELGEEFQNLDHESLLYKVCRNFAED